MAANIQERLNNYASPEMGTFSELEAEGDKIVAKFESLGIWQKLDHAQRLEPAFRGANISASAANRLNEVAHIAGIEPLVSPKTIAIISLLFKTGQAIDSSNIDRYNLKELNASELGLYKYPSYVPERNLETSRVLRVALLLHHLNHPWFAKAVLHGPHSQFFEGANLQAVIASLANANLAFNNDDELHSYLHPAVGLLPIEPYAKRSDELSVNEAKDAIDRIRMVAINTTLQHVMRTHLGISFSDESFTDVPDERQQRWNVVTETFRQLGIPFPSPENLAIQDSKNQLLKNWISENKIIDRLIQKEKTSGHLLYKHSLMVADLNRHLAQQINQISIEINGQPILNEEYMHNLGIVHDSIKAFNPEEITWLQDLKRYEQEFIHTYPAEVTSLGTIDLKNSHDAQLFAWLNHYEDSHVKPEDRGKTPGIADDLLSGPYHLVSLISAIQSYSDLAVVTTSENSRYYPDITGRFLDTTLKYISDPHTAVNGYAKLMTVVASLSWYLGMTLPQEGTVKLTGDNLSPIQSQSLDSSEKALRSIQQLEKVCKIFGIIVPKIDP